MKNWFILIVVFIMLMPACIANPGSFNLRERLYGINSVNAFDSFPHRQYLDATNIENVNAVKGDLYLLDSLKLDGGYLLSVSFTEHLKKEPQFRNYFTSFDSAAKLICLAEKYKTAAELDATHKLFYESVWDDWLNACANYLTDTAAKNSEVRLNHGFIYLATRLTENRHKYTAPPLSDADKVLYHISEKNWAYLFERFWIRTQWWFKTGLVLFLLLFVAGQISLYKLIKLKIS